MQACTLASVSHAGQVSKTVRPEATRSGMHALHGARPAQPVEIESKLVKLHSSWPCWSLLQYTVHYGGRGRIGQGLFM